MLTIKHIDDFGFERVIAVSEAYTRGRECDANIGATGNGDRPNFVVVGVQSNGGRDTFRDGQIYVMNDAGKTIASYDLRYAQAGQAITPAQNDINRRYSGIPVGARLGDPNAQSALGNHQVNAGTPL